jgi:hypothetical protein
MKGLRFSAALFGREARRDDQEPHRSVAPPTLERFGGRRGYRDHQAFAVGGGKCRAITRTPYDASPIAGQASLGEQPQSRNFGTTSALRDARQPLAVHPAGAWLRPGSVS